MRERVRRRAALAFAIVVVALPVAACVDAVPEGVAGDRGRAYFQAETNLALTSRLVVGSSTVVRVVPRDDEHPFTSSAALVSSAEGVFTLEPVTEADPSRGTLQAVLHAVGPGEARVFVQDTLDDGTTGELDGVAMSAAVPASTLLVDGTLLSSADVVDARLPGTFHLLADHDTSLLVAATDRCGGDLLDLHASSLTLAPAVADTATVHDDGIASFVVQAPEGGLDITLNTPGLAPLAYRADVVAPSAVDEVHAEIAAADSTAGTARLWGRAFVDDVDVVGVEFDWSADPRVTLDATRGAAAQATIAFETDAQGNPDARPAVVSAEAFGVSGSIDLLNVTESELLASRGAVPERASAPSSGSSSGDSSAASASGCSGSSSTCDPFAAFVFGASSLRLLGLRLSSSARRRRRSERFAT